MRSTRIKKLLVGVGDALLDKIEEVVAEKMEPYLVRITAAEKKAQAAAANAAEVVQQRSSTVKR